ncbi:MAG: RDD family protein [Frankiaceae bacterium]
MTSALGRPSGSPARRAPVTPALASIERHQGKRAGIVSRLLASTVDFVVVMLVMAAGYGLVSAAIFLWAPAAFRFPHPPTGALVIAGGFVLFLYLTGSWVTTGRTYGAQLLGLRVVDLRGERMGLAGAATRAALCVLFPLGVMYVLVSTTNRSVQDLLLRTSVVYDWSQAPVPRHRIGD